MGFRESLGARLDGRDATKLRRMRVLSMITTLGLAAMLLAIGIWDVLTLVWGEEEATVSYTVLALARAHPIVPLLVGILVGHLFWPQLPPPPPPSIPTPG